MFPSYFPVDKCPAVLFMCIGRVSSGPCSDLNGLSAERGSGAEYRPDICPAPPLSAPHGASRVINSPPHAFTHSTCRHMTCVTERDRERKRAGFMQMKVGSAHMCIDGVTQS